MHLIRLMPDGALDTTFNNHGEYKQLPQLFFGDFAFGVHDVLPLEDGRLLVGGSFTHLDGQMRRGVALLDSTGHLLGTALNGEGCRLWHNVNSTFMRSHVNAIGQAPDGSIYLAGFFKGFDDGTVSDTNMTFIAKLHGLSVGISEAGTTLKNGSLLILPNPAGTQVSFRYRLPEPAKGGYIRLVDALGQELRRLPVYDVQGEFMLDTRPFPRGIYTVQLIHEGLCAATQKLILQ